MNLRRNILGIVALTSLSATYAQTGKEWDNPAITSVNREVSHTVALPMASEADVQQNNPKLSPYYQSLDGILSVARWRVEVQLGQHPHKGHGSHVRQGL